jgi:predicted patatin/cPLA2 family phospholipase
MIKIYYYIKMTIKHLVIGGGGPFGICALGALKYLHDKEFWNINNIKSIYATSIGSLVAVYLSLKYEYDYIIEYIVKRPWEKIFQDIGVENILELYDNKGLINMHPILIQKYGILFEAKGLSPNITMKEFYEYSGIEFYFITCDANRFTRDIISYKTHPDLELITALSITSAFPVIFTPVIIDDKCYIDGGIFSNYAVNICLQETGCKHEEILGVKKYQSSNVNDSIITNDSNIIELLEKVTLHFFNRINDEYLLEKIPYEVVCDMSVFTTYDAWTQVPYSSEHRNNLIVYGVKVAEDLYESFVSHRNSLSEEAIHGASLHHET